MVSITLSEAAWRALATITEMKGHKLLGENSDRNEDGTYTVEIEDEFLARLKMVMLPDETVEGFILRCATRLKQ